MPPRRRLSYIQHQRRLRYWRDYYRRHRSRLFRRPGKTVVSTIIAKAFREATSERERVIQSRKRVVRTKGTLERLRLSISAKRRHIPVKERSRMLLGTRRSAQLRRGSRLRKGT